jgi:hypothetical protein
MKIFKSALLVVGTSVIGATLLSMPATAIDFGFSFQNSLNDTEDGTVTGVIRGLKEGTGAATSVEVLSNAAGYGSGEYVGRPVSNVWTVLNGNIVTFNFTSLGILNAFPAVTDASLFFNSSEDLSASFRAGINSSPGRVNTANIATTTEDISLIFTRLTPLDDGIKPVPDTPLDDGIKSVPEPTSILSLLLAGMSVIGTTLKRKQA